MRNTEIFSRINSENEETYTKDGIPFRKHQMLLKNHIIWLMNMVIIMWMNMVQCLLSCQRKRVKHILRNTF